MTGWRIQNRFWKITVRQFHHCRNVGGLTDVDVDQTTIASFGACLTVTFKHEEFIPSARDNFTVAVFRAVHLIDKFPSRAGFARNPEKSLKEILTTDFADCTEKHTATHPCDP